MHKNLFESKKRLEYIADKVNEFPKFYGYKRKVESANITEYIEYLKEVLEKNSPESTKSLIFDEIRSENKVSTLFFGNNLAYKYEK